MDQIKFFEKLVDLVRERKMALNHINQSVNIEFEKLHEWISLEKLTSIPSMPPTINMDISVTITDKALKDEIMGIIND